MRTDLVQWARRLLLLTILLAAVVAAVMAWQSSQPGASAEPKAGQPASTPGATAAMTQATPQAGLSPLDALARLVDEILARAGTRIGIVAGHSGHDAGAVCPDGLTEAEVNLAVAQAVVKLLEARGAHVDLLEEFDPRLRNYHADAFVSIHADSCQVLLTGFKVASLEGGSQASAELADCLWREYERATDLPRHPNTVTYDMSRYHAFREIAASTPAAIIEIGFLRADRALLTQGVDRVAEGIAKGIECFLSAR